ncbi:hypothetical protein C8R44DRAFT_740876 [Mycena epipterygia]|nr:hypothetical protein C8R44DRAFT_740876 [Mycena epipterygia]
MAETWYPVDNIAISWPNPTTISNNSSPLIRQLAQEAEQTLWTRLPLCAIAEAHKKEGDRLMTRGTPDANSASNAKEVYIEYLKYLRLYPYTNDPTYSLYAVCRLVNKSNLWPKVGNRREAAQMAQQTRAATSLGLRNVRKIRKRGWWEGEKGAAVETESML